MSPKLNEFVVILQRDGAQTPWGIRLVGGSDLDTPLIITKVTLGSPAYGELVRGDMITKIQDYDSRDLRHEDAQHLFKNAGNRIKVVVQRNNVVANQSLSNGSSRCSSTVPPLSPVSQSQLSPIPNSQPYRHVSPAGARLQSPYDSLPQTVFPRLNEYGGYEAPQLSPRPPSSASFSPHLTRDYQAEAQEEASVILNQPYRTTPLILPGAKVKKDTGPTESYLRHHPNPAMRGPPHHDFQDVLMKQKVVHKQFNSPIGLYSDNNIEKTIHQTAPNSVPIFIDLSFLKQKQKILEQQQQLQHQQPSPSSPFVSQHTSYPTQSRFYRGFTAANDTQNKTIPTYYNPYSYPQN
ncbi:LIM domain-binding protein 3 isoform X9 [Phlebotomus argentipes]|uniref:LIM domain-binding protein 3 isoform X9 n=1 Tax=Phlebotomus argentipes TaxID=94469 RepID=UPI00289301F3|nr:LIM domain-binding protein 3 isoform X9 [Phlebotomus argentipes]